MREEFVFQGWRRPDGRIPPAAGYTPPQGVPVSLSTIAPATT